MTQNSEIIRFDCVSRTRVARTALIRIVLTKAKEIKIDLTGKIPGRGAYLSKDIATIIKAKKTKALEKALHTVIPDDIYLQLEEILNDK